MSGRKIIEGLEEAVAIAKGETPAPRIWHQGHWYVPENEWDRVLEPSGEFGHFTDDDLFGRIKNVEWAEVNRHARANFVQGPAAYVREIECVQLVGCDPNVAAPPVWRVHVSDRCFDFDFPVTANNLATAINEVAARLRERAVTAEGQREEVRAENERLCHILHRALRTIYDSGLTERGDQLVAMVEGALARAGEREEEKP